MSPSKGLGSIYARVRLRDYACLIILRLKKRSSAKPFQTKHLFVNLTGTLASGVYFLCPAGRFFMMPPAQSQPRLAFGPFEVYGAAGVLLKSGVRIRLSSQLSKILLILLSHPGEVVTSEQLREQIWKKGIFVDFEHGLHVAVNKLRGALSDSAENPRYIETVPGRGYRFIGSLERPHSAPIPSSAGLAIQEKPPRRRNVERRWWLAAIAACVALSFAAGGWLYRQRRSRFPGT